ncbi:5-hydroxytryptamine receptor-like [Nematostella vectensis]|uniref:5-hydroxytryptamine receptor-like n=1 Tax=Nematostella vectensis TaxID=45351 RepID=UPI0020772403|nr:5-hydroxytryptamine receptor-like [Nematostella vectensis]XP_048586300.1 5-hydroxytryptamine receptor-like [Nematostella vectensis]XP_048586301.1 5-hydroxytryptamine receptor-like [Nematostella vectensis]
MGDQPSASSLMMQQYAINTTISSGATGRQHGASGKDHVFIFLMFAILLAFVTIFSNTLVVFAYKVNRRMRNRTIAILVSLAVSDLIVGAVAMPLWMLMTASPASMPMSLFKLYMSVDIFSAFASILHLAGVSVERYLAIASPLRHRAFSTKFYRVMLAGIWFVAAAVAAVFPIQLSYKWDKEYTVFVFVNGFVIPLLVISAVYISMFKIANSSIFPGANQNASRRFQAEKKLARTGMTLTLLFFFTWCPFFVVSLIGRFKLLLLNLSPSFVWYITAFVKFLHYSNSALNTFVYAFSSREMRRTFIWLVCCQSNLAFILMRDDKPRVATRQRKVEDHSIDSV